MPSCRYGYDLFSDSEPDARLDELGDGGAAGSGGVSAMGGEFPVDTGGIGGVAAEPRAPFGMGPFSTPVEVVGISEPGAADDDPSFTADRLELYFNTNRSGMGEEIWVSKRSRVEEPWGAPSLVAELNNADANAMPGVSADGLSLYFARGTTGQGNSYDIYLSTRPDRLSVWTTPVLVDASLPARTDTSPSGTNNRLFVTWGQAPAGLNGEVVYSERASTSDPWSSPLSLPGISSTITEAEPWISESRLVLYFRTNGGGADDDIYFATRGSIDESFSTPLPEDSLNSDVAEADPWLSQDLRYVMFASTRGGGPYKIYEAFRE